jgi:Heat shock protein
MRAAAETGDVMRDLLLTTLVLAAAFTLPAAAAGRPSGTFRLVAIEGAAPPEGVDVTLRFTGEGLSLRGPCNSFSMPVTVHDDGRIDGGPMMGTQMACADPARMAFEARLTAAVEGVTGYGMTDGTLRLDTASGALVFAPENP